MQWEFNVLTSVTLLAIFHGNEVTGISQETSYVIECIRDMIPLQVYNECCNRENNCTISRQQNRALDCMGRIIMTNFSSMFSESRENGPGTTTDMNFSNNNNNNNNRNQWYGDVLESMADACRRQPRSRLQTCIRNELVKRCRYSMLQDRFTTTSGRWGGHRRTEGDNYGYVQDNYGGTRMTEPRRRNHFFSGGGRRQPDDFVMMRRPTYYTSDSGYYTPRGGNYGGGDADEEEFGYSDSDNMRYN